MRNAIIIGCIALSTLSCQQRTNKFNPQNSIIHNDIKTPVSIHVTLPEEKQKLTSPIDTLIINQKIFRLEPISDSLYFSESDAYIEGINNMDTNLVQVKNIGIKIKVADSILFLKNDTSHNESRVQYDFGKIFPELNLVQIHASYWEWSREFLINYKSGQQAILWGNPKISKNKELLLSSSADLVVLEMPNGIQLFEIRNGQIKLVFEKEISNWEPEEIKWESDTSILMRIAIVDHDYKKHFTYRRMIIKE